MWPKPWPAPSPNPLPSPYDGGRAATAIDGRVALTSTQHVFDVELADVDRGVYEALSLKVARHPSESAEYLVARVLAYALELTEGLSFSPGGLSNGDDPAMWVRDLTGALQAWIEVGTPSADRLHKATKACDRVAVYCHKDIGAWLRNVAGSRLHAPDKLAIVELDRDLIDALAAGVERRTKWVVSVSEGEIFVDTAGRSLSATLTRHAWPS